MSGRSVAVVVGIVLIVLATYGLIQWAGATDPQSKGPEAAVPDGPSPPHYAGLFGPYGSAVRSLEVGIDAQKDTARDVGISVWKWLQLIQLSVVVAGALATAVVAVGNTFPKVAPWAIVPTTLVTMLTGIVAFYDFQGEYVRLAELRAELGALQSRVAVDIQLAQAGVGSATQVEKIGNEAVADFVRHRHEELAKTLEKYEQRRRSVYAK